MGPTRVGTPNTCGEIFAWEGSMLIKEANGPKRGPHVLGPPTRVGVFLSLWDLLIKGVMLVKFEGK